MHGLPAPDSLGSSTCLGAVTATGKLPRDISTLIQSIPRLAVAGSSQKTSPVKYCMLRWPASDSRRLAVLLCPDPATDAETVF
jgi:hypothetical protein